jgi:hypothetical protein
MEGVSAVRALIRVSLLLTFASVVWAQATAQIHGTVQDASGSAVPGAEVKATQTETGVSRTVSTGAAGGYVLTNLPIGPYQIEVSKEGFTKYVQSGIVLQVNSDPAIDPALKIGSVSEQVVVEANATQVETRSSGIGEVVQTQRIVELPLNGRNVTDLIALAGTSVQVGTTRASWWTNLPQIAVAGQAYFGTEYILDGASHGNYLTGTTMPVAFPDAVQEFKVESSGQSAQRGAAASVAMVTRSGANAIHGDLFEFIRNDGFGSAREYFSTTTSTLKRNQFGGTVGGPIKKNKLFYFGGFQSTIKRENPGNSIAIVPTTQMLSGDWSTFASAACNATGAKTLGAPFGTNGQAVNHISPSAFSGPATYIVNKVLPTIGTTPDSCGRITYNTPSPYNDYQYVGKIDYQLSDKQSIFFRALDTEVDVLNDLTLTPNLLTSTSGGLAQLAQSYAIGDTYLLGPNMVQAFRVAVNRTFTTTGGSSVFSYCDAGVKMWCGEDLHNMGTTDLTISGGFPVPGGTRSGDHWAMTSLNVNDDLGWVRGSHQMTFGAGMLIGRFAEINHFASSGQFTFTGQRVPGALGMADFMVGLPTQFFQGLPNSASTRQNSVNVYFTDSWKISSRLTFNFGVRWEPFLPQTVANGHISTFDMGRFLQGASARSTVFVNAPFGFYFPGDPGFPEKSGMYRQWAHFDPRGGLAWDPKGDGKTSIRAAYAFGYSYVPGITREDQGGTNPWGGRSTYATPLSFADPFGNVNGGNPFPYTIDQNVKFTPQGQFMTQAYDLPAANTYSWNVGVQRQIGSSWIAAATYIGSRVQHLYVNVPINAAQIVPGPIVTSGCLATQTNCNATANIQARRPLSLANPAQGQFVSLLIRWDPSATQSYQGALFSLQKRFSHNVSMSANWTLSHCTGYFQGFNSKPDQTSTVPNNPLFDRGNCDSDRRNIVNITAVAATPRFSGKLTRLVASSWQLAGIYRFTSGMPISIQDGTDRQLSGINHQRPNLLLPNSVYTGNDGPSGQYLNPKAFALQDLGTVGSLGWNSLVGPTYWDVDLAVSRQFHITERQSLEFRADAFNITNSFVSLPPTTAMPGTAQVPNFENFSNSQFGQNLAASPTRKMQFALKYTF